jgi:N utilization substance protein B
MSDPRHTKRIKVVKNLFAYSFPQLEDNLPYAQEEMTQDIINNLKRIDIFIEKYAPKYPLEKIAKTDLAILRLAIYELVVNSVQPKKVIIDEGVKLAKEFGGERSFAFVNAVLGAILKNADLEAERAAS